MSVTSTGTEKLKNLVVGDIFSTYDYIVSVTEVSGTESSGWTGRGYIEMNFLKLGPAAMTVPLAVKFEKIQLNQCYQLLPGSKVITEFDTNWNNVESVDDVIKNTLTEISDILSTYKTGDSSKLSELATTLTSNIAQIQANPDLTQDQKNMMIDALNGASSSISCLINDNSNSRVSSPSSCTIENVQSQVYTSMLGIEAANDRDCQCPKPTSTGAEGDRIVTSGTKYITNRFEGGTTIPCKKTWIYHSSYHGGKYPSDWYFSEDYKNIETFVKDKIGPLIFVHGTFSDPSTFSSDFKKNVYKYLKMNITEKQAIAEFQWSGGNTVADREAAATEMSVTLNSAISKNILKKVGHEKHIILFCHSHGGNVAKRLKNKLEELDNSWTVDVINIETPQRNDFQFNSTKGKILNFWSDGDFVQWLGTIKDSDRSFPNPGPLGVRKDPKASQNIQLLHRSKISLEAFGGAMYQWIINFGGHSLQGDSWYQWQIFHHIDKAF